MIENLIWPLVMFVCGLGVMFIIDVVISNIKSDIPVRKYHILTSELKPDDLIVLKTKFVLTDKAYNRLKQSFRDKSKIKNNVIILEDDVDINLLRKLK